MVRRIATLIILAFLVLPFVVGQVEVYAENSEVDLKQGCYNDGALCSSSASCNITVLDPNRLTIIENDAMTQHTTLAYFNYTLNTSQTAEVGEYEYRIICQDGTDANFGTFEFLVTSSGNDPSAPQVAIYAILIGLLVFFLILTIVGIVKLPRSNEIRDDGVLDVNYMKHVRLMLFFLAHILLVGITWLMWQTSANLVYLDMVTGFLYVLFMFTLVTVLPSFILMMLFIIIMSINDRKIQRALQRGLPFR